MMSMPSNPYPSATPIIPPPPVENPTVAPEPVKTDPKESIEQHDPIYSEWSIDPEESAKQQIRLTSGCVCKNDDCYFVAIITPKDIKHVAVIGIYSDYLEQPS